MSDFGNMYLNVGFVGGVGGVGDVGCGDGDDTKSKGNQNPNIALHPIRQLPDR
ncbi:MAG: hypothetical protein H8D67_30225 [Deltaproteobacteria bacterium]|nr:hypothetical protein [Deltaproteobacteria bacterium]